MEKNIDFSKGERGKFYSPDAVFSTPIHLEPEVELFLRDLATAENMNVSDIVNLLLKKNIELIGFGKKLNA